MTKIPHFTYTSNWNDFNGKTVNQMYESLVKRWKPSLKCKATKKYTKEIERVNRFSDYEFSLQPLYLLRFEQNFSIHPQNVNESMNEM